jgi:hypothetical protein
LGGAANLFAIRRLTATGWRLAFAPLILRRLSLAQLLAQLAEGIIKAGTQLRLASRGDLFPVSLQSCRGNAAMSEPASALDQTHAAKLL